MNTNEATNIRAIDIQRLRNLTTGRLHTEMDHVYEDIEFFTGQPGVMTHQIPRALRALQPWLEKQFPEPRLWDGAFDPTHTGVVNAGPMSADECRSFFKRYIDQPDPLAGAQVIAVVVDGRPPGAQQ